MCFPLAREEGRETKTTRMISKEVGRRGSARESDPIPISKYSYQKSEWIRRRLDSLDEWVAETNPFDMG